MNFSSPDFSGLTNSAVYFTAFVIAVVASLETLLCVEATDKIDPYYKNATPTNRELVAQGVGNMVSGMIGGLPLTQVIVRSSANIQSGGRTKLSAILHGIFILVSIYFIPHLLNFIPLASLAAVLIVVGYKLSHPSLYKRMYKDGIDQFIPFMVTIVAMVFTDLLLGVCLGLVTAIIAILYKNYKVPFTIKQGDTIGKKHIIIQFGENVTFLSKAKLSAILDKMPRQSIVEIDADRTHFVHQDIIEIIENFEAQSISKRIRVEIHGLHNKDGGAAPGETILELEREEV